MRTARRNHYIQLGFLGSVGVVLWLAVQTCVHGLTLKFGWSWFIVPLGAPGISFAQAMGISNLIWLVTGRANLKEKGFNLDPEDAESTSLPLAAINQTLTSLCGFLLMFIWHLFM
jgi:hypothetical protein